MMGSLTALFSRTPDFWKMLGFLVAFVGSEAGGSGVMVLLEEAGAKGLLTGAGVKGLLAGAEVKGLLLP